jgi:8-oxo-dGTP pyrophosphatase MutT (NUDIX family)
VTAPGPGGPVPTRPASTVALLRPATSGASLEVLLTHRPSTMAFGPGLHVFPGGAVDPGDAGGPLALRSVLDEGACATAWANDLEPRPAMGHAVAAIRELYEEAGILLAAHRDGSRVDGRTVLEAAAHGTALESLVERLDLVLRTDALVPLSRWVTPPFHDSRRYDTRFFVAELPAGAEVSAHAHEVAAHTWLSPAEALARYEVREIDLWPPTSTTLVQLQELGSVRGIRHGLAPHRPAGPPLVEEVSPGLVQVRSSYAGGRPGERSVAWIVGRERVVVVNPGGTTDQELDAILGTANRHGAVVGAVAVTSGLPEHVGGAVAVALVAGALLVAPPAAAGRIGEEARAIADGERVPGVDMEVIARVPSGGDGSTCVYEVPELDLRLEGDLHGGSG